MPRKGRARETIGGRACHKRGNVATLRGWLGTYYPGKCKDEITCRRQLLFPRFTRAFVRPPPLPPPFVRVSLGYFFIRRP